VVSRTVKGQQRVVRKVKQRHDGGNYRSSLPKDFVQVQLPKQTGGTFVKFDGGGREGGRWNCVGGLRGNVFLLPANPQNAQKPPSYGPALVRKGSASPPNVCPTWPPANIFPAAGVREDAGLGTSSFIMISCRRPKGVRRSCSEFATLLLLFKCGKSAEKDGGKTRFQDWGVHLKLSIATMRLGGCVSREEVYQAKKKEADKTFVSTSIRERGKLSGGSMGGTVCWSELIYLPNLE